MKDNFDHCLRLVLKHEGGFVNHPKDPGGMTNLGVTKRVWESWVKREVTEKEMRDLKPSDVRDLYKKMYWDACRCDELPSGVDYSAFDFAVNAGPKRSIITLQRSAGVKDDGIFGPGTMNAVLKADQIQLIGLYFNARADFYKQLKTFETFGKGWMQRANEVALMARTFYKNSLPKDSTDSGSSPSQ
jgi:lysozyme family protein